MTGGPTVDDHVPGLAAAISKVWGWSDKPKTQGDSLLSYATEEAELFHTPDDTPYATVEVDGHAETYSVGSPEFTRWLVGRCYRGTGKPPSTNTLTDSRRVIEAMATYEGPERPVYVRTARQDGDIYIDLGNESWEAVRVSPERWEIVSRPPVRFVRGKYMGALPRPVRGGSIEELRRLVNVRPDQGDFELVVAWISQALKPEGPYPILGIEGEQGSAKSWTTRLVHSLVDPSTAEDPLRTQPKEVRDLLVGRRTIGASRTTTSLGFPGGSPTPSAASRRAARSAPARSTQTPRRPS